jgi:hypothetical protein
MDYAIPQYDGVKVLECKYIPLSDIKRESNSGRESKSIVLRQISLSLHLNC